MGLSKLAFIALEPTRWAVVRQGVNTLIQGGGYNSDKQPITMRPF